jgi:hypothetical protein
MTFNEVFSQYPLILIVVIPTVAGIAILVGLFVTGFMRSGESFWGYLATVDEAYPIKPNSRLMYHKLAHVSDLHDTAESRLVLVTEQLNVINGQLEELVREIPNEQKIVEVKEGVAEVLISIQGSDNVTRLPIPARK